MFNATYHHYSLSRSEYTYEVNHVLYCGAWSRYSSTEYYITNHTGIVCAFKVKEWKS